jgi:hypothetical protein
MNETIDFGADSTEAAKTPCSTQFLIRGQYQDAPSQQGNEPHHLTIRFHESNCMMHNPII